MCSSECGSRWRNNSRNEWIPWRHILAGIAYLDASRRRAWLAEGCCEARKKSWCSWSSVLCKAIRACHCSLFNCVSFCVDWALSTSMHFDSTITSPAYIPLTSAINCSWLIGRVSGCLMSLVDSLSSSAMSVRALGWLGFLNGLDGLDVLDGCWGRGEEGEIGLSGSQSFPAWGALLNSGSLVGASVTRALDRLAGLVDLARPLIDEADGDFRLL